MSASLSSARISARISEATFSSARISAQTNKDRKIWGDAYDEEYNGLKDLDTFTEINEVEYQRLLKTYGDKAAAIPTMNMSAGFVLPGIHKILISSCNRASAILNSLMFLCRNFFVALHPLSTQSTLP